MDSDSRFGCSICFEPVVEPVVTLCGHLFCWPCLYRWTQRYVRPLGSSHFISNETPLCPVCKATIPRENVIPLYVVSRSGPSFKERKDDDCKTSAADTARAPESTSNPSLRTSPEQSPSNALSNSQDQDIPRRPSPVWPAAVPEVPHVPHLSPPLPSTVTGSGISRSHNTSGSNGGTLNVIQLSFTASMGLSPSLFALQFQPTHTTTPLEQQGPYDVHEFVLRAALVLGAALTISLLLIA